MTVVYAMVINNGDFKNFFQGVPKNFSQEIFFLGMWFFYEIFVHNSSKRINNKLLVNLKY